MMTFLRVLFLSIYTLIAACGFKNSNTLLFNEFYIENIENTHNKKIDFIIKQSLRNKLTNESALKKINIKISNTKDRTINEKNIQNEITKYEVRIKSELVVTDLENLKSQNINVVSSGIYNVVTAHIDTKRNQENLERYLSNQNVEKILRILPNLFK